MGVGVEEVGKVSSKLPSLQPISKFSGPFSI